MEIDDEGGGGGDVEGLLSRMWTLGTRDKDDLIQQFQMIVGNQMSPGCCSFYLESANWNLQTALCAYYDVTSTNDAPPSFQVVEESRHVEECCVGPNQTFTKTWRLKNTGTEMWGNNLRLKHVGGVNFGHGDVVAVPQVRGGEVTDINVPMTAPQQHGVYHAEWKMITVTGTYVGDVLNVAVCVGSAQPSGSCTFSLTQHMSMLGQQQQQQQLFEQQQQMQQQQHSEPIATPCHRLSSSTPYCSPTGHGIFGTNTAVSSPCVNGQLAPISETHLTDVNSRCDDEQMDDDS